MASTRHAKLGCPQPSVQGIQDWEAMADLLIDEKHMKNTIFGRSEYDELHSG